MRVVLELTEFEAIVVKDALKDRAIELRTINDKLLSEGYFLATASDGRKQRYNTLKRVAEDIVSFFRGVAL